MLSEVKFLLPFVALSTVTLVLLSDSKKRYSIVALGLMFGVIGLDTLFEWDSLSVISQVLSTQAFKSISVFITFSALILMTSQKQLLDLTVRMLILFPLLIGLALSNDLFYFTINASLVLAVTYYQICKGLRADLLKTVIRSAYLEIIFIVIFGLMGLLAVSFSQYGRSFYFPYVVSVFVSYLFLLIQGPINIRLKTDGLTSEKLLALSIPKSIICLELIIWGQSLFEDLKVTYQNGLSEFIFMACALLLGTLSFLTLVYKSREKYSKLYVLSLFAILSGLVVLGVPSDNSVLLNLLILDTVISFCALIGHHKNSLTSFVFSLHSTLLPIGVVFLSKLLLIRFVILESDYHPFSYLVLINQVCLTLASLKLISSENIGKINLSPRHAVYLSCVIISACLMVILP